ncbi:hypothetical protein R1flu_021210 [Riccia fluitans]|uniref:EF-hand domain-containing protein n=1 Tax=Riccia fluitans TaxID=41844 RepID=A0ABD1ZP87_9MARC
MLPDTIYARITIDFKFNLVTLDRWEGLNLNIFLVQFVAVLGFFSSHSEFANLIKSAFEACDSHNDGTLSQQELEKSLRRVFPEIPKSQVCFQYLLLSHEDLKFDGSEPRT